MLTDAALRNIRGKSKSYKMTDRDGLYILVSPAGGIAFKYDYRFNGRRESVTWDPTARRACRSPRRGRR